MIDTNTTLDILFLNQDLAKECKCEWAHSDNECSKQVTHIYSDCQFELLICDSAFQWIVKLDEWKMRHYADCMHCNRLASECWSLRPV